MCWYKIHRFYPLWVANWSKWGIPERDIWSLHAMGWGSGQIENCRRAAAVVGVIWSFLGGCRPPRPTFESAYRPPGFTGWVWLLATRMAAMLTCLITCSQDGCHVDWFITLQPGWLPCWLVWLFIARMAALFSSISRIPGPWRHWGPIIWNSSDEL